MDIAKNGFLVGAAQAAGTLTTMAAAPHVVAAARKVDDYVIEHIRPDHPSAEDEEHSTLTGPIAATGAVLVVMGATTIGVACAFFAAALELRSIMHKRSS